MAKAEKQSRPRVQRAIRNMVDMEIPPIVKSSIYPWDTLIPQEDDDPESPARNFFVECEDAGSAEKHRSSVYGSGRNYYLKRGLTLIPICRVVTLGDGVVGVGCWVVDSSPN